MTVKYMYYVKTGPALGRMERVGLMWLLPDIPFKKRVCMKEPLSIHQEYKLNNTHNSHALFCHQRLRQTEILKAYSAPVYTVIPVMIGNHQVTM